MLFQLLVFVFMCCLFLPFSVFLFSSMRIFIFFFLLQLTKRRRWGQRTLAVTCPLCKPSLPNRSVLPSTCPVCLSVCLSVSMQTLLTKLVSFAMYTSCLSASLTACLSHYLPVCLSVCVSLHADPCYQTGQSCHTHTSCQSYYLSDSLSGCLFVHKIATSCWI